MGKSFGKSNNLAQGYTTVQNYEVMQAYKFVSQGSPYSSFRRVEKLLKLS